MVSLETMRARIKEIVQRDDVKYVIGYEAGTYGWRVAPSFAKIPEEVDKLIFSPLCINNLVTYVVLENRLALSESTRERQGKIGVVVKGCDSRAVVLLLQEHAISREDIILIGIPCQGVIDPQKMETKFGDTLSCVTITEQNESYFVNIHGIVAEVPKEELISEICKTCQHHTPVMYDLLLGEPVEESSSELYSTIEAIESQSVEERWNYWKRQFDRCIRCYACRNICPVCNCEECMADMLQPTWMRRSVNISENTAYHTMRAFHMAGRCISCGMCEKACPVNIPLSTLYKKVEKDVLEQFDYTAGIDHNAEPLFSVYSEQDSDVGIL